MPYSKDTCGESYCSKGWFSIPVRERERERAKLSANIAGQKTTRGLWRFKVYWGFRKEAGSSA